MYITRDSSHRFKYPSWFCANNTILLSLSERNIFGSTLCWFNDISTPIIGCKCFDGITSENSAHPDIRFVSVNAHADIPYAAHMAGIVFSTTSAGAFFGGAINSVDAPIDKRVCVRR